MVEQQREVASERAATLEDWRGAVARWRPVPDGAAPHRWRCLLPEGGALALDVAPTPEGAVDVALSAPLAGAFRELVILPRPLALATAGALATGDAALDGRAVVFGAEGQEGLFEGAVRAHLTALVDLGGHVAAGVVCVPATATRRVRAREIGAFLDHVLALGRALRRLDEHDNDAAIVRLAGEDPDPGVRAVYRPLAAEPSRRTALTRWTIEHAGPEDASTLVGYLGDRELPAPLRERAAVRVVELAPAARLETIAPATWAGLDPGPVDHALAAAVEAARGASPPGLTVLARALAAPHMERVSSTVAGLALASVGAAPGAENEALLRALLAHPALAIREGAAHRIATSASLPVLLTAVTETRLGLATWPVPLLDGVWERLRAARAEGADPDLRRRVREAVLVAAGARPLLEAARAVEVADWLAGDDEPRALGLVAALFRHPERAVKRAVLGALARARSADAAVAGLPRQELEAAFALAPEVVREARAGADLLVTLRARVGAVAGRNDAGFAIALGAAGGAEHARHLPPLLDASYADAVMAAIDALGAIGTLDEVSALEPLTKGLFRDGATKERARAAIAAITARHTPKAGGLSLADREAAGGVTLG